jgi:hypothetical protein
MMSWNPERLGSSSFTKRVVKLAAAQLNFINLESLETMSLEDRIEGGQFRLNMVGKAILGGCRSNKLIVRGSVSRPEDQNRGTCDWMRADLELSVGNQAWHVTASRDPATAEIKIEHEPVQS